LKVDAQSFRELLLSRLQQNRDRVLLRILLSPGAEPVELTGADILSRAPELARRYQAAAESSVVLLLLPHSVELFLLHFGLILEGRLPAILAWPTNRIDPEKYQRNLLHQLRHLPADQLITLPRLATNLAGGVHFPVTECGVENARQLEESFRIPLPLEVPEGEPARPRAGDTPADAIFLQFSGGTTGAQKAVAVTASLLAAQLESLRRCLAFTAEDGVASWLPLYHDMGLIACLWFPLWCGAPSLHFSANDWLLNPELLFRCLDRYRATFCWLPNFAFSYLAAQRGRMKQSYSLGHVRAWINCSEPVRLRSFREFAEAFAPWGVTVESLQASYAMAENIFAVTQTPLGLQPRTFPRSRLRHRAAAFQETAFERPRPGRHERARGQPARRSMRGCRARQYPASNGMPFQRLLDQRRVHHRVDRERLVQHRRLWLPGWRGPVRHRQIEGHHHRGWPEHLPGRRRISGKFD
jgi:acyl-CoA synthetase (AMP-forming)/AMP-acid ligase II